jgi:TonB family protein
VRILKLFQWVPAVKDGQYVSAKWSETFNFVPGKYAKICRERGFQKFRYLTNVKIDKSGTLYKNPDQLPMYQKGNYALQDFIKENLEYPRQARLSNIQGTVVLRFVVEPSGLVTNIGIQKSIGGGCDQEAVRVLQMIKWYPGKKDDKLVRAQMTFPFYFILNDEFRDNSGGEQK